MPLYVWYNYEPCVLRPWTQLVRLDLQTINNKPLDLPTALSSFFLSATAGVSSIKDWNILDSWRLIPDFWHMISMIDTVTCQNTRLVEVLLALPITSNPQYHRCPISCLTNPLWLSFSVTKFSPLAQKIGCREILTWLFTEVLMHTQSIWNPFSWEMTAGVSIWNFLSLQSLATCKSSFRKSDSSQSWQLLDMCSPCFKSG